MQLKELFKDFSVKFFGDEKTIILGLCPNSKKVQKGDLFIARSGSKYKAADFVKEALAKGACAILTDHEMPSLNGMVQVVCENLLAIEGQVATRFYQNPSEKLKMIALTGTNGKTTTSYLIRQLLGQETCGLIGTIEYILGKKKIDAPLTTPDVVSNHKMLSEILASHQKFVVMEVTSIALTQNRLDEIDFDIALFTNFSQDHLDYHGDMKSYLEAKALLFTNLAEGKTALVNVDHKESSILIENCRATVKTYGIENKADYRAVDVQLEPSRSLFVLEMGFERCPVEIPLSGMYNVYNALSAISVAIESGMDVDEILRRAKNFTAPNGRLESIPNNLGAHIFVDFAHTEDALKNAISALRQIKHNRLITLFGCGGDRDPQKRPLMGKTVSSLSDITFITSDNPRSEDPQKICDEVYAGCSKEKEVLIEVDREKAILKALKILKAEDVLLIAGRGHEKHQIIGSNTIPFQDARVTKRLLGSFN